MMFIIIITYIVIALLYIKGVMNILLLCRAQGQDQVYLNDSTYPRTVLYMLSLLDVIFFTRLFRINKPLWLGEWLFHLSFIIVLLAHLRYILVGLPSWWSHIVCMGKYAGLLMPLSLLYILVVRASVDWRRYISPGNLCLIVILLIISVSGLLMRYIYRTDIVEVKRFMVGLFTFSFQPLPEGRLFMLHYLAGLVLLLYLPSHVLTAPVTISEARRREGFRI